jgi:hypothetical protein
MPRVIEHGIPVPDPIHPQIPFALLTALAVLWSAADRPQCDEARRDGLQLSHAACFSPQQFFRPPPARS